MPAVTELIAHDRTVAEIETAIGADWLIYQDLEDLQRSCLNGANTDVEEFDCSVFDSQYVTGDINQAYFDRLEAARSDASKSSINSAEDVAIDLHNDQE
jgi:amidophosphoribosyltransferase